MSEFMDRARAEAEGRWPLDVPPDKEIYTYPRRATREHKNAAFASGALWALYQQPTDKEVEAATRAMFAARPAPGEGAHESDWQDAVRAALIAAQKVRAGQ